MIDVPPSTLRVLSWLLVAPQAKQSAEEIQRELDMSSGAVSMALNTLHYLGLIERISAKGSRKLWYRAVEDMAGLLVERQVASFRKLHQAAEEALAHNPGNTRLRKTKMNSGRVIDLLHNVEQDYDA